MLTMGKPAKLHDVQKLAGRVAELSRFVARLGEKALPFYALMKKSDEKFEWTEEADTAFVQLKKVLSTPPVLVTPKEREPLLLYIAATHQVVSTVLVVERSEEGKAHGVQRPVYFLSEVLSPTKQRYPHYQKLAYSVFTTSRKLRQYFVVHPIIGVNEAPLSNILNNPAATGRVSLWGIKLSPLDITYEKRKVIKSQVLPDFTAEWLELQNTGPPDLSSLWTMYFNGSKRVTYEKQKAIKYQVLPDFTAEWLELQNTGPPDLSSVWTMYFDGSERVQGIGAGVILISPQGDKLKYMLRMSIPQASNQGWKKR
jgi:hypothetical protein